MKRYESLNIAKTKTYKVWQNMKQRCKNPSVDRYERYGGRGITYCPKWDTFAGFIEDMGFAPPHLTLDRINNDGNYNKENCRWATDEVQRGNKSGYGTSKYKNVYYNTSARCKKRWRAIVTLKGKRINIGSYETEEEAYEAVVNFNNANRSDKFL